jgi:hypothetical protein|uniref:Uncharacterized protein n=2 Tax=Picea TaxID=3328 RepID=A0A117NIT0_PICGL|nr:hypothetical protein ABT39_MTgene220 [Picea glauca]QHR90096.1 hypothetical protein Q903MT_gene4119 [Picea sitchensis]
MVFLWRRLGPAFPLPHTILNSDSPGEAQGRGRVVALPKVLFYWFSEKYLQTSLISLIASMSSRRSISKPLSLLN